MNGSVVVGRDELAFGLKGNSGDIVDVSVQHKQLTPRGYVPHSSGSISAASGNRFAIWRKLKIVNVKHTAMQTT